MLGKRSIYDIKRPDLLEVIARIERRKALSVAEKVRTWFNQMFRYALVVVPGLEQNPASDLDVVALPLPPVNHNPFLRMAELPKLLQRLRKYRPAADPARSAAAAIHRRAHGRAALGDAGSVRPRSGPLDHPARGREAAPGGHAQEAPVAQGHSTLHRAAVGAGHRDCPAPAGTVQTGPALSVPPRQRIEEAHEREHTQRRAQAHGLSRPADRAWHPGHDVHRAQRDRLPEGVGGRTALARRSQQGQRHLQPRRVRRAAAADDAGLGRPARSLRAEPGRSSEHAAHHPPGGRARPLGRGSRECATQQRPRRRRS